MTSIKNGTNFIKSNLGAIGASVGGAAIGGAVGYALGRRSSKKKRKKTRTSFNKRSRRRLKRKIRRTPYTAGKRKDRSHKRIRYSKNGQPYIILASGKARFISKKSARLSRKRKGGKY